MYSYYQIYEESRKKDLFDEWLEKKPRIFDYWIQRSKDEIKMSKFYLKAFFRWCAYQFVQHVENFYKTLDVKGFG